MFWRVIILSVFFITCNVSARPQDVNNFDKVDIKDDSLTNIRDKNDEFFDKSFIKPVDRTSFDIENELVNDTKVSYEGAQLWKIWIDNNAKRALVWQLKQDSKIQTWGGNATTVDVLVYPPYGNEVAEILKSANVDYVVNIPNLQRAIDLENPPINEDDEELTNRNGHRMNWNAYHRLADIYGYLDYLSTTYPSLCTVKTIGRTVQGREMKVLKISNGNPGNKAVWVDGGIHAREWISPASVTYMINQIVENYETESQDIKNMDLYFIPVANPDGYEYSFTNDRLWRKNRGRAGVCTGTDLNRNYGYHWGGKGSSKNPCTETYGGTSGFSEPETAAIRDFILNNGIKFVASISYHSYGQYILYPWGYDRFVTSDRNDLHKVGVKAAEAMRNIGGAQFTVGAAATTLYPAAGGSDDWAKGVANIKYAYTIELRDTGRYGFILPAQYIVTSGKEALAAFRVIVAAGRLV